MALDSDNKKPTNPLAILCGLAIGSMPAMLQMPVIGKILIWLLGNFYFLIFYLFMVYLPWMMGSLFGRVMGLPVLIPTIFCIFYWGTLGCLVGNPKYSKKAWFYIMIAHVFVPMVFLLNAIRFSENESFSISSLFNVIEVFSQMLGQ